jgi:hypothetical protein
MHPGGLPWIKPGRKRPRARRARGAAPRGDKLAANPFPFEATPRAGFRREFPGLGRGDQRERETVEQRGGRTRAEDFHG